MISQKEHNSWSILLSRSQFSDPVSQRIFFLGRNLDQLLEQLHGKCLYLSPTKDNRLFLGSIPSCHEKKWRAPAAAGHSFIVFISTDDDTGQGCLLGSNPHSGAGSVFRGTTDLLLPAFLGQVLTLQSSQVCPRHRFYSQSHEATHKSRIIFYNIKMKIWPRGQRVKQSLKQWDGAGGGVGISIQKVFVILSRGNEMKQDPRGYFHILQGFYMDQ